MLVSSAKIIEKRSSEALEKSFMYKIKRSGPKIDPWGTLCVISLYQIYSCYIEHTVSCKISNF